MLLNDIQIHAFRPVKCLKTVVDVMASALLFTSWVVEVMQTQDSPLKGKLPCFLRFRLPYNK